MIASGRGRRPTRPRPKRPDELRMDHYFLQPSVRNHRQRLQSALRAWLIRNPNSCGGLPSGSPKARRRRCILHRSFLSTESVCPRTSVLDCIAIFFISRPQVW